MGDPVRVGRGANRRPRSELPIGNRIALPIVVILLAFAGYVAYSQSEFGHQVDGLEADVAAYREYRWERPALRGVGVDGNAAHAVWEALGDFGGLRVRERDSLALSLHYGENLSGLQRALIEQEEALLAAVRAAGRYNWASAGLQVDQGLSMNAPDYPRVVDAALLLLASGVAKGPDECLEIAADVVRLGQDLVPGAPLEALSISARLSSLASRVAGRCAGRAGRTALSRAAREFHTLARVPPPVGSSIELHDLLVAVELRGLADLFSERGGKAVWWRLHKRPELAAAALQLRHPSRWRDLASTDYPATLEAWRGEHQQRARSRLPLLAAESVGALGFVFEDMRAQAAVRATTVALATLAERLRRGKIPARPEGVENGALVDPFTGRQLRWRIAQDGSEIAVWSVGEDLRDDKGIDEWTTEAPLDVVVHMGFRPLDDVKKEERKSVRRRGRKRG